MEILSGQGKSSKGEPVGLQWAFVNSGIRVALKTSWTRIPWAPPSLPLINLLNQGRVCELPQCFPHLNCLFLDPFCLGSFLSFKNITEHCSFHAVCAGFQNCVLCQTHLFLTCPQGRPMHRSLLIILTFALEYLFQNLASLRSDPSTLVDTISMHLDLGVHSLWQFHVPLPPCTHKNKSCVCRLFTKSAVP